MWLGLSILCWIKVVRVDIFVLFLILEGMLSAFHHWVWCQLWFAIYDRYFVEIVSLYAHFLESFFFFNTKWMLNFGKSFFCIYWEDHVVFILQFVNMVSLIDLRILKNPCIPGMNPTWSWLSCMILLMYCWIWFADILLRIFASYSSVILACNFLFLWYLCLVLVARWWWPHTVSLELFLPLQFLE